MRKSVLVIANTKAGRAHQTVEQFMEMLDKHSIKYDLHKISAPPEAKSIIDSVSEEEVSGVISYGGDGTTAVIIKAAARKNLPVLPLRGGTANGLANSIGITSSIEENIKAFSVGNYIVRCFPLATVSNEPLVLDFHFGVLAKSVLSTPRGIKKWLGDKAYVLNTIKNGMTETKDAYRMKIDGIDIELDAYGCYVANTTTATYLGVSVLLKPKPDFVRVLVINSRNPLVLVWWYVMKRLTGRSNEKAFLQWYAQKIEFYKSPSKMIFDDHERDVALPMVVEAESQQARLILPIIKKQGLSKLYFSLLTEFHRRVDHSYRLVTGNQSVRFSRISSRLYLGGQYGHRAIPSFAIRGITGIVSMREYEPKEIEKNDNIEILHLPTKDQTAPTIQNLQRGVISVTKHIENGGSVYIHCRMGEGRGPTMAAAYLISTGMSTEQALLHLKFYRPFARPNKKQVKVLKEFEAKLKTQ